MDLMQSQYDQQDKLHYGADQYYTSQWNPIASTYSTQCMHNINYTVHSNIISTVNYTISG